MIYQLKNTPFGEQISRLNENGSISHIPQNPANTDYQEYLEWLAEGNEPEIAEADNGE